MIANRRTLLPLALAAAFLLLWVSSYLYMHARHATTGRYASPPVGLDLRWRTIHYDKSRAWARILYRVHGPLASADRLLTGTEIDRVRNDYAGQPANYGREAFE